MKWLEKEWRQLAIGFSRMTKKHWQLLFLSFVGMLMISGSFLFFIPQVQKKVRASQLASVVFPVTTESKVQVLPYGKLDDQVKSSKKTVVIFIPKEVKEHDELLKLLQDEKKTKDLKETVYVYPFIYDTPEDLTNYRLSPTQAAVISYQDGKQMARKTIRTEEDRNDLIDLVNQLFE